MKPMKTVILKEENKKLAKKSLSLWGEFKAFISRGSVIDLAVGVIIGGAFSAIVTALVNILLSLCTWAVPGGLKGLVTVLPAVNSAQAGVDGIGQAFDSSILPEMTIVYARSQGVTIDASSDTFIQWENALLSKYTLHGSSYYFNSCAIIDWGTFINAVIAFLIIALTLFIILKIVKTLHNRRALIEAKAQEEYFKKHPEERPAPVVPGAPKLSETDLLIQIRDLLKNQHAGEIK